jgi:hypothetical protein
MPALLELSRNRDALRQQLIRRIGYTEGLFRILRHADVLEAIADALPLSVPLVDTKLREAMRRFSDSGESAKATGRAYGEGVRNVLIALGFLRRTGAKLALSARGRALVAVHRSAGSASEPLRALLAASVIDADGDYALNVLTEGPPRFARNVQAVIARKRGWFEGMPRSPAREFAIEYLDRSKATLFSTARESSDHTSLLNENTLRHTVTPRAGWLRDLRLGPPKVRHRVVSALRDERQCAKDSDGADIVTLGLAPGIVDSLKLEVPAFGSDLLWRVVALIRADDPELATFDHSSFYEQYAHLRLRSFNQVEIEAVFEVQAANAAAAGQILQPTTFVAKLNDFIDEAPDVWRLSARRSGELGGYIAVRRR